MTTQQMIDEYLAKGGQITHCRKNERRLQWRELLNAERNGFKAIGRTQEQREIDEFVAAIRSIDTLQDNSTVQTTLDKLIQLAKLPFDKTQATPLLAEIMQLVNTMEG